MRGLSRQGAYDAAPLASQFLWILADVKYLTKKYMHGIPTVNQLGDASGVCHNAVR